MHRCGHLTAILLPDMDQESSYTGRMARCQTRINPHIAKFDGLPVVIMTVHFIRIIPEKDIGRHSSFSVERLLIMAEFVIFR